MAVKRWWLYILKLEHKKWYVGITSLTPEQRFRIHAKGGYSSAHWVRTHKPISIHYKKDLGVTSRQRAEEYEDKVTRKYINTYGINNVRGGDIRMTKRLTRIFNYYIETDGLISMALVIVLVAIVITLGIMYQLKS